MKSNSKLGISLIAVLMFMLAATTASIVVFRWIAQENFASGARLKSNEAYQASQAGLKAVQSWLANKGADVGALVKFYEDQNPRTPVFLVSETNTGMVDLLAGTSFFSRFFRKQQDFDVYLTGVEVPQAAQQPYKLKFLSVGTARDGSRYSQVGIFNVDGLYTMTVVIPAPITAPDVPAFFGGISSNTQGKFSSAIINGDLNVMGIATEGNLLVTGNMTVQNNTFNRIGCKSAEDNTRVGDMYVVGNTSLGGFTVCGNSYIGGLLTTTTSTLRFLKSLYADGGINSSGFSVGENMTLGNIMNTNSNQITISGNLVMEGAGAIGIAGGSNITVGGHVWSENKLFSDYNNNNPSANAQPAGYNNLTVGGTGKSLFLPSTGLTNCAIITIRGCDNIANRWFQSTTGTNYVHFTSQTTRIDPLPSNKPEGAELLTSMADQITDCEKPDGTIYKCVPDPLEVPQETKDIWLAKSKKLDTLVNIAYDTAQVPKACIRLVKSPRDGTKDNLNSEWASNSNNYNFMRAANECYEALSSNDFKDILYQNGDQGKKFLPLIVKPNNQDPSVALNGNFIFAFEDDMNKDMKLPPTTNNSNVFIYFKEGATGNMPLESSCLGLPSPCKRNYFIFSEKDIKGSTGSATINGAIFLANGSKVTGSLPDAQIEFNANLYRSLVEAGIIGSPDDQNLEAPPVLHTIQDVYHIPATSHLKVKLESQYANEEELGEPINAKPAILVMPRAIYLKPGEASSEDELKNKKLYRVLYLNGATKPAVEATPVCPANAFIDGALDNPCKLTSNSPTCGEDLCSEHPFYIVITGGSSASGDDNSSSSGSNEPSSSSANVSLICSGLGTNAGIEGTAIGAPTLTCVENGASIGAPSGIVAWSPEINWSNPAPGIYPNITATATCGTTTGVVSNSCGDLQIISSTTLECKIEGNNKVAAGMLIPDDRIRLTCSNGATATNTTYAGISWTSPAAGTYDNISVIANCGASTGLTADCDGSLTVVGLECTGLPEAVKSNATISEPTLRCLTSNNYATISDWLGRPNNSWTMPETGAASYSISVKASCDGVNDLEASCGTVTRASISCTGLQSTIQQGETINQPNLLCVPGSLGNATAIAWSGRPSDSWENAAIGTYPISATANCGSISGLSASCGSIRVVDEIRKLNASAVTFGGTETFICENPGIPIKCLWTNACSAATLVIKVNGVNYTLGSYSRCDGNYGSALTNSCPSGSFDIEVPAGNTVKCENNH
jgi:hypothetical protein